MPYSYRPEHASDADALDPRWWNLDQSELAGTFNGGLDRDNYPPNVVSEAMCGSKVFLDADSSIFNGTWSPDMSVATWQDINPGGTGGTVTITAAVDCHVEVDFSATWQWNGAWSGVAVGGTFAVDTATCRLVVNGNVACEMGPSEDMRDRDCVHVIGNVPLGPGKYTVKAQVLVTRLEYAGLDAEGNCTNTLTFTDMSLVAVERRR